MKKLLGVIFSLIFLVTFTACTNNGTTVNSIGDGKIDTMEAASISLVAGLYLYSNPKLVKPTYDVANALLVIIDNKTVSTVSVLDLFLEKEVAKLNFDKMTQQSFMDLVKLIKAKMMQDLNTVNISETTKLVMVREVIYIVQQAAFVRL